eukprot:4131171-Prymnesium_polylepis.1
MRGTHAFHAMEFDDYIAGACFDKEPDAKKFETQIKVMAPKPGPGAKKEKKSLFGGSSEKKKKAPQQMVAQDDGQQMVIGAPTNFKHLAHVGWDEQ